MSALRRLSELRSHTAVGYFIKDLFFVLIISYSIALSSSHARVETSALRAHIRELRFYNFNFFVSCSGFISFFVTPIRLITSRFDVDPFFPSRDNLP